MKRECIDCDRMLPMEDYPRTGGPTGRSLRCRICLRLHKLPKTRAREALEREDAIVIAARYGKPRRRRSTACAKCGGPRETIHCYCRSCSRIYQRERRARIANGGRVNHPQWVSDEHRIKRMRGVDIDAIHRKRKAIK